MKRLIAIKHVAFEDLGYLEEVFQALGYSISYFNAGKDPLSAIQEIDPDLLVICGGPISVNDEALYPFLHEEFKTIENRLKQHRPTLGLCLGAQSIAKVLGSRIYPNHTKEIGWAPITLTDEGSRSPLRHLAGNKTYVFHWHGETFDLPTQTALLASTTHCQNQAFSYEHHTLGLQFHPEVIPNDLEQWYIGHACELSHLSDVNIVQLRLDAQLWGHHLKRLGSLFIKEWVSHLNAQKNNSLKGD